MDTKLPISGNIRLLWALPNAFANYRSATTAELNAALDLADSTSWNDFDFGMQASAQNSDPAISAKGNVQDRGAASYGGNLSFYFPRRFDDNSNQHSLVYDALGKPRTVGYIIASYDGEVGNVTPTYTGGATTAFQDGDFYHIFRVQTDGYAQSITGEEAFRYTVSFLSQGTFEAFGIAHTGAVTVDVTPATATVSDVAPHALLRASVLGREFTRGVRWSSSAPEVATVSPNGVVTRVSAGSATITATHEASGATDTSVITSS